MCWHYRFTTTEYHHPLASTKLYWLVSEADVCEQVDDSEVSAAEPLHDHVTQLTYNQGDHSPDSVKLPDNSTSQFVSVILTYHLLYQRINRIINHTFHEKRFTQVEVSTTFCSSVTNPTRDMGHTDRCRWPHNNDWYRAHGTWHASDSSRWTPGSQTPIAANWLWPTRCILITTRPRLRSRLAVIHQCVKDRLNVFHCQRVLAHTPRPINNNNISYKFNPF